MLQDLCQLVDLGNPSSVAERLPEDEKTTTIVQTSGGPQKVLAVTEMGM